MVLPHGTNLSLYQCPESVIQPINTAYLDNTQYARVFVIEITQAHWLQTDA